MSAYVSLRVPSDLPVDSFNALTALIEREFGTPLVRHPGAPLRMSAEREKSKDSPWTKAGVLIMIPLALNAGIDIERKLELTPKVQALIEYIEQTGADVSLETPNGPPKPVKGSQPVDFYEAARPV